MNRPEVPRKFIPLTIIYSATEKVKQAVHDKYPDYPCSRGCSLCCRRSQFLVTQLEWEAVLVGVRQLPVEDQREIQAEARRVVRERMVQHLHKGWWRATKDTAPSVLVCPLLSEGGACRVYAFRPSICRLYGYVVSNDEKHKNIHGCEIVDRYVEDNGVKQLPAGRPIFDLMEKHLSGDSRPLVGWLADSRTFSPGE